MARIICLANSRKNLNRCVAGLTENGLWIRPVSKLSDGAVPPSTIKIDGEEPRPLNVLEIPLERSGPDFGHQPENRLLKPGRWLRVGEAKASEILKFCQKKSLLLHTDTDRVPEELVAAMRPAERFSLQLIRVEDARFYKTTNIRGKRQVRAEFTYSAVRYDIVVTDPIVETRVGNGESISQRCILTVSMGGPYKGNYFKFIAGVIEID